MVRQFDAAEAMPSHRRAAADWLNAKRLTPQVEDPESLDLGVADPGPIGRRDGYGSFCAAFALAGNDDASASPYSNQAKSASKIAVILPHLFMLQSTRMVSCSISTRSIYQLYAS